MALFLYEHKGTIACYLLLIAYQCALFMYKDELLFGSLLHNYALMIRCGKYGDLVHDVHLWGKYFHRALRYNGTEQHHSAGAALMFPNNNNNNNILPSHTHEEGLAAWLSSFVAFHYRGDENPVLRDYDVRNDVRRYGRDCEALDHVFHQGECPACFAFAFASTLGARLCLVERRTLMPSPHRIFDCAGKACEEPDKGMSAFNVMKVMKDGVPDIRETPPIFGWGCQKGRVRSETFKEVCGIVWIKREIFMNGPVVMPVDLKKLGSQRENSFSEWNDQGGENRIAMHALMIIGWSVHPIPHWISKNSWGREWGDSGVGRVPWGGRDCAFAFKPLLDGR
jgi:hypothetical protein